jgi:type I restriction enzyme, S subunit
MPRKGYKSIKWYFGKDVVIPEEWDVVKFRTKIKMEYGSGLREDKRDNLKNPVYGSGGLIGLHSKPKVNGPGIIVARKGSLGNVFFEKDNFFPIDTVYYITEKETELNLKFLFYYLLHIKLENLRIVTSKPGISREDVYSYRILSIPLLEQQKIASILSNVDSLIDSTSKVIKNSKRIKKGLMQKLLILGISHKKFKNVQTSFRKNFTIPESWEIISLHDTTEKEKNSIADGPFGSDLKTSDYDPLGTIPVLTIKMLYDISNIKFARCITKEKFSKIERSKINGNDIVMAKIGNTYGVNCIYPEKFPTAMIPANMCKITINSKKFNRNYLKFWFDSKFFKDYLDIIVASSAQPAFGITNFKKLPFIAPPLPEQQKIATILLNIDSKITSQEQYKEKLQLLKKSLMQKLLTGEVRVN